MAKQWAPYREEILRLYMIEDLTLDQVMGHMSTSRGFDRKKHQYEHRLKIWGARKNMKREEWEYISHQHRKQNRTQHRSNVYVDGVLLGTSRLARALQRYQPDVSLARKFGRAHSPELPHGHLVRLASSRAYEISIDWPKSLPWLQFEQRFTITLPQSTKLVHLLAQTVQGLGLMPAMESGKSFDFARAIYLASREAPSGALDLAGMLPLIPNDSRRSAIPSDSSNSGGIAAQLLKTILFQISNNTCRARDVPSHCPDGSHYLADMTGRGEHLLVLFHELHKTHPIILDQLLTWTDPTSEAIVESLYEDAVRYGRTALVSTLLKAGRDVNALLRLVLSLGRTTSRGRLHLRFNTSVRPMTPLQWAASVCDVKLATLLINSGAKANLGEPAPLAVLCWYREADDADISRFANLLICHGARVNISTYQWVCPLMGAVVSENKDLVRLLLQHGAMDVSKPEKYLLGITLTHDLLRTKDYELLFPRGAEQVDPMSALQLSMVVNNSSITDMLIHSISNQEDANEIFEWALVTACVAGEEDLVRRLLAHLQARFHDKISLVNEIILATALDMDCRIAHLLIDHGVVQKELRNSSFSFFQAAALHGNISLIKLLKSKGFDVNFGSKLQLRLQEREGRGRENCPPPPIASTPVGCAVWMGHQDAIEILLAIGADVSEVHLVCAIQSGSQNLVSQVLGRCDDVDELWDGQRALDVAIRHCRGITLIRKLIDAGAILHGHELVDAVRSDDRQVVSFLLPSCDVLAVNKDGENVLEAACRTGNIEMAISYYACGGAYSSRALLLAASRAVKTRDYHVVEHLVTTRQLGPIDEHEASALALSIRMEDSVLVEILISDQFEPSSALSMYCRRHKAKGWSDPGDGVLDGVYPLDYDNQHIGVRDLFKTDWLLRDWSYDRLSPMLIAALMEQRTLVSTMLDRGYFPDHFLVRISFRSQICIEIRDVILAAYISQISLNKDQAWNEDLLLVALEHHVDIKMVQQHVKNLPSLDFWRGTYSLLQCATLSGRLELVELLLKAGASPTIQFNAFVLAIEMGNLDIASTLLDYGADIKACGPEAFSSAFHRSDVRAMSFLLEKGADVNTPYRNSLTPLEVAANQGLLDAVELLLTNGVDIRGRMRIHFIKAVISATRGCHYATAKLLKERGGWTKQDQDIAKTPRALDWHSGYCPRVLYDDPSLEACENCLGESDSSSWSSSDDDESTISDSADLMPVTEQLEDHEVDPLTDELSIMDLDSETIEDGQTTGTSDWSLVPYGPRDRELDDIVRGLLLEDGMIVDLE